MIRPLPLNLAAILVWQLVLISLCAGDKYTAPIDYGFGPLTILVDADGGTLTRCQDVKITLGGGFAPYKLVSVDARNKTMPIQLKTDKTAIWTASVSEGSRVSFNVTSRAGATFQTPLFKVVEAEDDATCGNSTLYMDELDGKVTFASGSAKSAMSDGRIAIITACIGGILVPAFISILF